MSPTPVATAPGTRVRRELVHRANEQEILVSPPWRAEDGGYGGTTVTTDLSPYYRDHPGTHWLDALLLIEACRQAALSAAHEFEDLSSDIAFFFNSIDMEITEPAQLAGLEGELTILSEFEELRLRGDGSPKQITYHQRGTDGSGRTVVRTSMAVQGLPKGRYPELRAYQRGGSPAPTTAALRSAAGPRTALSTPASVARTEAADVAIAGVRREAGTLVADLAPDFGNGSLFDHDYDHYPAMVLIEAGRQLALSGTPDPAGHLVTAVSATFDNFAELDAPIRLVARPGERRVDVNCLQGDLVVTRMSFALAPAPGGKRQA
ncbi:AfsA-related hotdog domain-containing protein [Streptomyces sp. CoH27]|uniref:AfsA-related hotdog domain-containing protein n=1 Tax=Streptomyces sp. CoH27 TaxID=2875763 RepID=UPI001CD7454A|nr:AfsA-related hotdog domain-containing protein [Streptomyces sp. CoH27]